MRKCILFIAMSLDGYIADKNGGVDWLAGQDSNDENIDTYSEFAKEIDTVLMGRNTYHQITAELSPDNWIYSDFTTYVITHNSCTSTENIRFTDTDSEELVKCLKQRPGKDIWICGGADLVGQLMSEDLIDMYYITVIPTLLGAGTRLFKNEHPEIKLHLVRTQSYNGMTELIYTKR